MNRTFNASPRKWTDAETNTLKELYKTTSYTTPEIARIMNRTPGSVGAKITVLNLATTRFDD